MQLNSPACFLLCKRSSALLINFTFQTHLEDTLEIVFCPCVCQIAAGGLFYLGILSLNSLVMHQLSGQPLPETDNCACACVCVHGWMVQNCSSPAYLKAPTPPYPTPQKQKDTHLASSPLFLILSNVHLNLSSLVISSVPLLLISLISHPAIILHALSLSTSSSCLSLTFFSLL